MEINDIEAQVRAEFLRAVADCVRFWIDYPNKTPLERCNGVAFSILVIIDGCSLDGPSLVLFGQDDLVTEDQNLEPLCPGYVQIGKDRELHAEYGKYKPRPEPGNGEPFMRRVSGFIRHIFGKR